MFWIWIESVTVVLLSVRFAHKLTGLLWLWWRKEYRYDRMLVHMRSGSGTSLYASPSDWLLAGIVALILLPQTQQTGNILLCVYAVFFAIVYLVRYRRWHIPPHTPKVFAMVAGTLGIVALLVYLGVRTSLVLAGVDLLLFPLTGIFTGLLAAATSVYHRSVIRHAEEKLRRHQPMRVIGITGSYGKTSVKEYLATILESKYKTMKTVLSRNSPIGIAETVNSGLSDSHEAFVVEMGAYRPGEIAEMTRLTRPQTAVITAINAQHQDLFGSIETTITAKYELVEGLSGNKIVVINADNPHTRRMGIRAQKSGYDVYWWTQKNPDSFLREIPKDRVFKAESILAKDSETTFICVRGKQGARVRAPVIGAHQAGNITAAIAAATVNGVPFLDACTAAGTIRPAEKVMRMLPGVAGSTFIDDTFNNNPDAAAAAFAYLEASGKRSYAVFQPMIELGSYAQSSHESAGAAAARACTAVILTNRNYADAFKKGAGMVSPSMPVYIFGPEDTARFLKKTVTKGNIVLFKGKDAEHTLRILTRS